MSQTPPQNRLAAMKEDGFIDFYELLGVEPDATITRLRTTINALFNEAQSNRDHRNLNRRREYQTLLQLLPDAREFLLEEKKRERYDAFREDAQRGVGSTSFEDWVRSIREEEEAADAGRSAVLGVQGVTAAEADFQPPRASVTKVANAKNTRKPVSRVVVGDDSPSTAPARASLMGSVITIVVFAVLVLLLHFVVRLDFSLALLIACIGGIIAWFATHRKGASRTSV